MHGFYLSVNVFLIFESEYMEMFLQPFMIAFIYCVIMNNHHIPEDVIIFHNITVHTYRILLFH